MTTRTSRRSSAASRLPALEWLEARRLLTVAVGSAISPTFGAPGAAATAVDLAGTFDQTDITGTVVRMSTSLGNIDVELYDQATPATAQNFVNYVANHLYDNTVIHRSVPGFILQGGGYTATGAHISEGPAVKNEFSADRSNLRGTIAMAKLPATDSNGNPVPGGGPDSATSEWFFNLADNSSNLDGQNGGFTVFGKVIDNTMGTVDAIAGLPVYNATAVSPVFSDLPVRNTPAAGTAPGPNDFVFVNSAAVIPETKTLTITATSDNPTVISPSVTDGVLSLNYGNAPGSARITVTATDAAGSSASQTFVAGSGELTVQIGSGGVGSSVNFVEADGGKGAVSLSKGGSAFVRFTGTGLVVVAGRHPGVSGTVSGIAGISTIDTTTNSALTVTTRGGDGAIDVGGLTTDSPLKTLSLKPTRFTGTLTVGGTVRSATFGTVSNAALTFGGAPADGVQLALALGSVTSTSVTSGMPIKSIKATEFLAPGGTPLAITAPTVTSVATRGAFQEALVTTGAIKGIKAGGAQKGDIAADSIGSLSAASLDGGIFNFTQALTRGRNAVGKVSAKGAITGTTIRAAGNIGSISAGSIASGRFYAGADVPDEEFPPFLPTTLAQFTAPARIASIKVATGVDQLSVAAATLGKLALGKVATDGPIPFGLAATSIDSLTGATAEQEGVPSVPFAFKKLDEQSAFDAEVTAKGVPLGNFIVRLF